MKRSEMTRCRGDLSNTDFSGLEHTAQEREAIRAWGERQLDDLEDRSCTPQEEDSMLVGVGLFVLTVVALAYFFGPAVVFLITKVAL